LLPVDEAFVLRAEATGPDRIELSWAIADGYYLYRHRMGVEPLDGGFRAAPEGLQLPAGKRHTDEFFGEVETYRGRVEAVLPGTATGPLTRLKVRYQGCADLGICYPPQTRTITVALPAPAAGPAAGRGQPDAGFSALGQSLGSGPRPLALPGAAGAMPLPEDQAFAFEAIADGGNSILVRLTPAPGYYLYRDQSRFQLEADGIRAGAPRWPRGTAHRDAYFGDVVVYFDGIDVPLPLLRSHAEPRQATLTATFQGCQADGICYPPMTRRVRLALPAGTVAAQAEDAAPAAPERPASPGGPGGTAAADADATDASGAASVAPGGRPADAASTGAPEATGPTAAGAATASRS